MHHPVIRRRLVCVAELSAETVSSVGAGGLLLPETPNSLIERGHLEEARRVLKKIRGTEAIDVE